MRLEGVVKHAETTVDLTETAKELAGVFKEYFPKTHKRVLKVMSPVLESKSFKKVASISYIDATKILIKMYPMIMAVDPTMTPAKYFDAFKTYNAQVTKTVKVEKGETEDAIARAEARKKADRDDMLNRLYPRIDKLLEEVGNKYGLKTEEDFKNCKALRYFFANTISPTAEELNRRGLTHDPLFFEALDAKLKFPVSISDIMTDFRSDSEAGTDTEKMIKEIYAMEEAKGIQSDVKDDGTLEMFEALIAKDETNPLFAKAIDMFMTYRDEKTGEIIRRPTFDLKLLGLYDWPSVMTPEDKSGITAAMEIARASMTKEELNAEEKRNEAWANAEKAFDKVTGKVA
jgi:hypothetical protein